MVKRCSNPLKSDSFFIFGARGTGKSTFVKSQFLPSSESTSSPTSSNKGGVWTIDLLDADEEEKFSRNPKQLETELLAMAHRPEWVFIDEVQKVPKLLDHVHRLIENEKQKFILTGSTARKLKRAGANLLAGRAFVYQMFPLTHTELNNEFSLELVLNWGSLPKTYFSVDHAQRRAYLKAYVQNYLKQEVLIEQYVREMEPFREFLEISAQTHSKPINFSKIAREVGVADKTIAGYFQILEDTLLGFHLPAFHRSIRKAQTEHPRFYFFDLGVKRFLERSIESPLVESTFAYGEAFEHFLILEFYRLNSYLEKDYRLSYFRSKEGQKIDLIISPNRKEEILIEIKATKRVDLDEVAKLQRLASNFNTKSVLYLSQDPNPQKIDQVLCLPWQKGLAHVFPELGNSLVGG